MSAFGSKGDIRVALIYVRFTPKSGHSTPRLRCLLSADFVAEVGDDRRVATGTTFLIGRLPSTPGKGWCGTAATELCTPLCKAVLGDRRRSDDELCESAEVLRDCC